MPYNYAWAVADEPAGLDFGQNEASDGSLVTGEYRVLLPDGRTQIVRSVGGGQMVGYCIVWYGIKW